MNNLLSTLLGEPAVSVPPFTRRARYHPAMDMMLYLVRDEEYVAERVDDYLTLLWSGRDQEPELIGLKLKGFRNLFLAIKATNPVLAEEHFLPLISVLQRIYSGGEADKIMQDPVRKGKYEQARKLAEWAVLDLTGDALAQEAA